jgi:hypothetical protein
LLKCCGSECGERWAYQQIKSQGLFEHLQLAVHRLPLIHGLVYTSLQISIRILLYRLFPKMSAKLQDIIIIELFEWKMFHEHGSDYGVTVENWGNAKKIADKTILFGYLNREILFYYIIILYFSILLHWITIACSPFPSIMQQH